MYVAIKGLIQDVTQRKQGELALHEAERRFRSIFENAVEGVFQSTTDRTYLAVNPAMAIIFGYGSTAEMMAKLGNKPHAMYVGVKRCGDFFRMMAVTSSVTNFESCVYQRNGKIIDISENMRAIRDRQGQLFFFEGLVIDITERKSYEQKIRFQATHDALTCLPNRNLLEDQMNQALINSRRTGDLTAIAFVDLDRFKMIHNGLGHQTGDELLQVVADRLQHCLRGGDTVVRHGGDEFVVLLGPQKNLLGYHR